MFFVLGEVLTMSDTKKRRFKPFSRRRKEKQKRLEKQIAEFEQILNQTAIDDLGNQLDFKKVLTIRPLVLDKIQVEKLEYVEPRIVTKDEFPVFEEEFKKVKKALKEYAKKEKQLEKKQATKPQSKSASQDVKKLQEDVTALIDEIEKIDGVLLLNVKSESFLRKDYRDIVGQLKLKGNQSHSTWWSNDGRVTLQLLGWENCKQYSSNLEKAITGYTKAPLSDGHAATLDELGEKVLRLLKIVNKTLEEASRVMDRFSTLSMKTRVLGRKTFYGDGYENIKQSYSKVEDLSINMVSLMSEISLAKEGLLHVVGETINGTTNGSGKLLRLATLVSNYNRETSALHGMMKVRRKMAESEFKNHISKTTDLLNTLAKDSIIPASKVTYEKRVWSSHCMNLKTKVDKARESIETLAKISTYYITLEQNLKSSALGRVLLLKDRYGHYLDAIQTLCSSLPKVF